MPLDGPDPSKVLASMIESAFGLVGGESSGRRDLDRLLNKHAIREGLRQLPSDCYCYFPSNVAPKEVVDWILGKLVKPKPGEFPPLKDYERVVEEYQKWLANHAD
jgi:hypothetical protein